MRTRSFAAALLGVAALNDPQAAHAQSAAQSDVQITSEAIARTCGEIHKNPGAQSDGPGIGPRGDLVLTCRLIGPGGMTLAQVAPGEVCQRLTGSPDWYRGMGTQVYCRAGVATTPAPPPRSFTMTEEDISKACQKVHRNPQAMALPPRLGPSGALELGCRLINESGTTLASVSPEEVCETRFGVRDYMAVAGSPSFVCKGRSTVLPNKPPASPQDGGVVATGAVNDVVLNPEGIGIGCRNLHGPDATAAALSYVPAPGRIGGHEIIVNCTVKGKVASLPIGEFCPHLSGTPDWYLTDFGRGTWLPGEQPGAAPRLHVCRGKGPLEYPALADIARHCVSRGYGFGNFGAMRGEPPVCHNATYKDLAPIDMAVVCRQIHRASRFEIRGSVYFCLPEAPPPAAANGNAPPGDVAAAEAAPPAVPTGPTGTDARPEPSPPLQGPSSQAPVTSATDGTTPAPIPPATAPAAPVPATSLPTVSVPAASSCPDCGLLEASIDRYREFIATQDRRIAEEEAGRRALETEAKRRSGRSREEWEEMIRTSSERLEGMRQLRERMDILLKDRQRQLVERAGRCPSTGCENAGVPEQPTAPLVLAPGFEPAPTSTPPPVAPSAGKGGCEETDHVAELTNGERVFHRLFVVGSPSSDYDRRSWAEETNLVAFTLQTAGRQSMKSTARILEQPTQGEFMQTIRRMQRLAEPCQEVTIYLTGHGIGGYHYGYTVNQQKSKHETLGEAFGVRSGPDGWALTDRQLGDMIKGFKPGVSVVTMLSVCFGGGFAGPRNIEQSALIKVIGLANICPNDGSFDGAIREGIDARAAGAARSRVTADDLRDYLTTRNWPLGEPYDNIMDTQPRPPVRR